MMGEPVAMEPLVIRREVEVEASIEAVWRVVGTADGLRRWFAADAIVLEPWPGGRYEEHAVYDGEPHHVVGSVLTYDPPQTFVHGYRAQRADGTAWPVETIVSLFLTAIGARTRVVVEHSGFERLPVEYARRVHEAWSEGWGAAFEHLPEIVREEIERPAPLVVRKEIEIDAPPDRVWPYVATQAGYTRWSCTVADVYDVVLEERVGGAYREHGVAKGDEWTNVGRILTYDPPRALAFMFQSQRSDGSLSPEMTVTITLMDLGRRTRVLLEHTGFEGLPAERRAVSFRSFDQGWGHALEELFGLIAQDLLPALGRLLIYQSVEISAPADRVWWFLATEEGRQERNRRIGYPPSHYDQETFEPREGGRWESSGISAHSGDRYRQFGHIVRYDPPRLLVMTLQEEGWPAATTVTYRLTEYFGKTRVTLIHSGFEHLPPERREAARKAYAIGRFKSLERLRALVEGREVEAARPLYVRKEIEIDAPVDRVWEFIGTQQGSLRRHQAENVPGQVGYAAETLEERVGGRYEIRGIFHGEPFRISGEVLAYDPPRVLALSWREEGWPVDTLVRFRLTDLGGRTRVVVVHNGFEHLPAELRDRAMREYETGRQRGLEVLRALAEQDAPGRVTESAAAGGWAIERSIEIEAPAAAVWPFVGTADGLRTWWEASVRRITLDPHVGGRFELVVEFDRIYTIVGQVVTYDPPRVLVLTWRETDGQNGEWPTETLVTFTLTERAGRTLVRVVHSGFDRLPEAYREAERRSYENGWTQEEMERLRALVLR